MEPIKEENIQYFAITGLTGDIERPHGLMRVVEFEDGEIHFERIDEHAKCWVEDEESLAGYYYNGEVGAEKITNEKADELTQYFFSGQFREGNE